MLSAYLWGLKHFNNVCTQIVERKALGPDVTQKDFWKICQNSIDLLGQLDTLSENQMLLWKPLVDKCIEERTIPRAIGRGQTLLEGVTASWADAWREWARKWLSGEDRSSQSAQNMQRVTGEIWVQQEVARNPNYMAEVAFEAASAAKSWSKGAAEREPTLYTCDALRMAKWTASTILKHKYNRCDNRELFIEAEKEELKLQADDIRYQIPEWPGDDE